MQATSINTLRIIRLLLYDGGTTLSKHAISDVLSCVIADETAEPGNTLPVFDDPDSFDRLSVNGAMVALREFGQDLIRRGYGMVDILRQIISEFGIKQVHLARILGVSETTLSMGVTGNKERALARSGLGDVPACLRPFSVLSCGEQFRAGLARLIADPQDRVVIDEFTSALDRTVAGTGSMAFAREWRKTGKQCLLLTCVSTHPKGDSIECRIARIVVLPEYQGIGIGHRFINQIAEWCLRGSPEARHPGRPMTTLVNNSASPLCRYSPV